MKTHFPSSAVCDVASLTETASSAHCYRMVSRIGHNARPHAYRHFLREWRKRRNLTLVQLAERMAEFLGEEKFSHAQLSRIENGKTRLAEDRIYAAANSMNIEPSWLFVDPDIALKRDKLEKHFSDKSDQQVDAMIQAIDLLINTA